MPGYRVFTRAEGTIRHFWGHEGDQAPRTPGRIRMRHLTCHRCGRFSTRPRRGAEATGIRGWTTVPDGSRAAAHRGLAVLHEKRTHGGRTDPENFRAHPSSTHTPRRSSRSRRASLLAFASVTVVDLPGADRRPAAPGVRSPPAARRAQRAQQRGSGAQGGRARQAPRRPADPSTAKDSNTVRQARGEASTIWAASAGWTPPRGFDPDPFNDRPTASSAAPPRVGVSIEATTRLFARMSVLTSAPGSQATPPRDVPSMPLHPMAATPIAASVLGIGLLSSSTG